MTKNMGTIDRGARVAAAVVVGVLYATGVIGGVTAAVLGIIDVVSVLTSLVGTCPLYLPFGLSTRRRAVRH